MQRSPRQEFILHHQRIYPTSCAYNVQMAYRFFTRLDAHRWVTAFHNVCQRYPTLHTCYPSEHDDAPAVCAPAQCSVVEGVENVESWLQEDYLTPLQPCAVHGKVIRGALLRTNDGSDVLVITAHHCAVDGLTKSLLWSELMDDYGGVARALPSSRYFTQRHVTANVVTHIHNTSCVPSVAAAAVPQDFAAYTRPSPQ